MAKLNQFEIEAIKLYISVPLQQQTKFLLTQPALTGSGAVVYIRILVSVVADIIKYQ